MIALYIISQAYIAAIIATAGAIETIQADLDVSVSAAGDDYNADTRQSLNQTKSSPSCKRARRGYRQTEE